jgi:hypothetical protein
MKATIDDTPVSGTPEEIKRFKDSCEGEAPSQDLTTWHPYWQGIYPPASNPQIQLSMDGDVVAKGLVEYITDQQTENNKRAKRAQGKL